VKLSLKLLIWVGTAVIGLAVLALGLIYILPGYHAYIVRSDSMKPVFSAGDLIIDKSASANITIGTIVSYKNGSETVTHRVVALTDGGVITRGDGNDDNDPGIVAIPQVQGTYFMKLPYMGYVAAFIQTRTGWLTAIIIPAILLLIWIVIDIVRETLKPEGALAAEVVPVERRRNLERPVKIARAEKTPRIGIVIQPVTFAPKEKAIRVEKIARSEEAVRSPRIIPGTIADRRYYEAFKPQTTKYSPLFFVE